MIRNVHVVKLGGKALDSPLEAGELAREAVFSGRPVVFVHGGGSEVSEWCRRLGVEPRFENGLRVTDPETLEIAVAVLSGLANRRLTALFRDAGLNAVGLSALDGGVVQVAPAGGGLGAVGRVVSADPRLLDTLLDAGFAPVLASIAANGCDLLNVNADDVAAAVAGALRAETLTLLSDVDGVRLAGRRVAHLTPEALEDALSHPDVSGGMLPKLAAAKRALEHGVRRVEIGAWAGAGTLAALREGTAAATMIGSRLEDLSHA